MSSTKLNKVKQPLQGMHAMPSNGDGAVSAEPYISLRCHQYGDGLVHNLKTDLCNYWMILTCHGLHVYIVIGVMSHEGRRRV